ncbi:MAG: hypothetical protein OEV64_13010 [Desulfobulbaceae bacterium]|nr:hypothetical protein [Desulfobulbaceae bacterium]
MDTLFFIWQQLIWPLIRLLGYISIGLLVANFIEALNWTQKVAFVSRPLIHFARLSPITGASFSMAFFSGVTANTMLSEAFEKQEISKQELVLANLFNSLPTYFLHLPTTFFITLPLIKSASFLYIGLTLGAAVLRTLLITVVSRFLLSKVNSCPLNQAGEIGEKSNFQKAWAKTWLRFKKRIRKICIFTVPIYILFFIFNRMGIFGWLESLMAEYLSFLSWLSPQAMSIVALHIAAEFTAGLAAAGALLQNEVLDVREVVLALLVGNILSSPVRIIRHQFPYYAGIFPTRIAMELIVFSQLFRMISVMVVTAVYYVW